MKALLTKKFFNLRSLLFISILVQVTYIHIKVNLTFYTTLLRLLNFELCKFETRKVKNNFFIATTSIVDSYILSYNENSYNVIAIIKRLSNT